MKRPDSDGYLMLQQSVHDRDPTAGVARPVVDPVTRIPGPPAVTTTPRDSLDRNAAYAVAAYLA